jgi:hypothetical protein
MMDAFFFEDMAPKERDCGGLLFCDDRTDSGKVEVVASADGWK